ncbi:hypothetical protein LCGC14_2937620, partial [marine sediment metagenome]
RTSGGTREIDLSGSTNNIFSATSISATTFYSGSTDVSDLINQYFASGTGVNSIIQNNETGNIASGLSSIAIGSGTTAGGTESFVIGKSSKAIGNFSFSSGFACLSSGIESFSSGFKTSATTNTAVSLGNSTLASGTQSLAIGTSTIASGTDSVSQGNLSVAEGNRSIALGNTTLASGDDSFAQGFKNTSEESRSATLGGQQNSILPGGTNSVVIGGTGISGNSPNTVYFPTLKGLYITGDTLSATTINTQILSATSISANTLLVSGTSEIVHFAKNSDDHAFEIDVNAKGFGDVNAQHISYVTGAIISTSEESVLLVNIDEIDSIGGDVVALQVLATSGNTRTYGMGIGATIKPIKQLSGTFGDADSISANTIENTS